MPRVKELSILNKNTLDEAADSSMLYDMSIDRCFERIIGDVKKRSYFLSVLSMPLHDSESIRYRQDVLRDFIAHPSLMGELSQVATRFSAMKKENDDRRASLSSVRRSVSNDADMSNSRLLCQVSAAAAKSAFMFTEVFSDALSHYAVNSEGLRGILDFCRNIRRSDAYDDVLDVASALEKNQKTDVYTANLTFSGDMKLLISRLSTIGAQGSDKPPEKSALQKLFSRKSDDKQEARAAINWYHDPLCDSLVGPSFRELDSLFLRMARVIYDTLSAVSRELVFYECALAYKAFADKHGLPSVFPEIRPVEENTLRLVRCYDPLLCATVLNVSTVIPNDADIKAGGMLIRGENNTGKTVYLRSIGSAQILAQSGLPVLAEAAEISPRSGIFTHFAAAEKDFTAADAIPDVAGRFEEEVKELSDTIAIIKPNSLVMLNETFQTTAYDEGAEGIYHIINYLRKKGAAIVFVTHLTALFDRELGGMTIASTAPGYKIIIN